MILIASCFYDCIVLHSLKKKKKNLSDATKSYSMKRLSVTHSLIQIEPTPIMAAHYPCKLRVCASVRA